jgi:hypothetical protein
MPTYIDEFVTWCSAVPVAILTIWSDTLVSRAWSEASAALCGAWTYLAALDSCLLVMDGAGSDWKYCLWNSSASTNASPIPISESI